MQIQEEKLNELLGKVVTEYGAAVMGLHVHIGDKLGLYRALGANGGITSQQLADTTGTAERYVREWLAAQAATGYVDYTAEDEHVFAVTGTARGLCRRVQSRADDGRLLQPGRALRIGTPIDRGIPNR